MLSNCFLEKSSSLTTALIKPCTFMKAHKCFLRSPSKHEKEGYNRSFLTNESVGIKDGKNFIIPLLV
jgi:hypothetical protein